MISESPFKFLLIGCGTGGIIGGAGTTGQEPDAIHSDENGAQPQGDNMDYRNYRELAIARAGSILTVTMNRPERLNAIGGVLHEELSRIFQDIAQDEATDVVILTGAGEAFSAGGDIDWLQEVAETPEKFEQVAAEAKRIIFGMLECDRPVIARVNGPATGLGATIALFCDIIVAADTAKIGDPHVRVGVVAGDGGAVIWPQLVGYARAKEYLMTGDLMTAAEAERIGLINHVVAPADLDAKVNEIAGKLARGATKAIRWTKMATNIGLKQLAHSMMDASLAYESLSNRTADHLEAVRAFREKRKPVFTGR